MTESELHRRLLRVEASNVVLQDVVARLLAQVPGTTRTSLSDMHQRLIAYHFGRLQEQPESAAKLQLETALSDAADNFFRLAARNLSAS